jgi:hypothetical protein
MSTLSSTELLVSKGVRSTLKLIYGLLCNTIDVFTHRFQVIEDSELHEFFLKFVLELFAVNDV